MANRNLGIAKAQKKDEFYTQYRDIEAEMRAYLDYNPDIFRNKTILLPCDDPEWSKFTRFFAANFEIIGLKKLISTSYAPESKKMILGDLFTDFERSSPKFDEDKSKTHGKIFILERTEDQIGKLDVDNLKWDYLDGDGDFRSAEVTRLRDEADFIITNPPFSLFFEFFDWIMDGRKKFSILANNNDFTIKRVATEILANRVWLGPSITKGDREFQVPQEYPLESANWRVDEQGRKFLRVKSVRWLTNIDHGYRHHPRSYMTLEDNVRFSRHKDLKLKDAYRKYDNYNAIEVPYSDAIPSDCNGVMGVPITFLDTYCPEQFELLGFTEKPDMRTKQEIIDLLIPGHKKYDRPYIDGRRIYARLLIKKKQ